MFSKRAKESNPEQRPPDDASQTAQSGSHQRNARLQDLERQIEEERANTARIQSALDAQAFQREILEKSYAKQLAEARDKLATVTSELQEKDEILAGLGGGHEHTLRELADAVTVIKVLKTERDQLRKRIAEGGFRQPKDDDRPTRARAVVEDASDDGTINALIANAGWTEKKSTAVDAGHSSAQVSDADASPSEEMIAPDLVFTAKDREDDEAA